MDFMPIHSSSCRSLWGDSVRMLGDSGDAGGARGPKSDLSLIEFFFKFGEVERGKGMFEKFCECMANP